MTLVRAFVVAVVLATTGIALTPAAANAAPTPQAVASSQALSLIASPPIMAAPWAGQDRQCVKVKDSGRTLCINLKVSAVKSRQLTAEMTPSGWEEGTVIHRSMTILNLKTRQYIWQESTTCMITERNSCEIDYYGSGCKPGRYRVDSYAWLTNRNWSLHARVTVTVR